MPKQLCSKSKIPQEFANELEWSRECDFSRSSSSSPRTGLLKQSSKIICLCSFASRSHAVKHLRLTVFTDLRVFLLEVPSVFIVLALQLSVLRMTRICFDMVLCEARGIKVLVLDTSRAEDSGRLRGWFSWRGLRTRDRIFEVYGCRNVSGNWGICDISILLKH